MFCTSCGKALENGWLACPSCGTKTAIAAGPSAGAPRPLNTLGTLYEQTSPATNTDSTDAGNRNRKPLWISIGSIILAIIALNSIGAFNGLTGQVTLDSGKVETEIESGIYDQSGFSVTATCPSPMAGKVGETRSCSVEDESGTTYVVDVTIQNKNADVLWVVRN